MGLDLSVSEERIPPVRGLILLENRRLRPYAALDIVHWIRLSRVAYAAEKVDFYLRGQERPDLARLFEQARNLHLTPSLRTNCAAAPVALDTLTSSGLHDVFLSPSGSDAPHLDAWLRECRRANLPVRLQLNAPFVPSRDSASLVSAFADAGVVAVNLAAFDPLDAGPGCRDAAASRAALERAVTLANALSERGIETNLLHIPFCQFPEHLYPHVVNSSQFFLDHQQYTRTSYELAELLNRRGPTIAGKILLILLTRHTLFQTPFDNWLLPWLMRHPVVNFRVAVARRLTRHWRILPGVPKAMDAAEARPHTQQEAAEAEKGFEARQRRRLDPVCRACALIRVCDRAPKAFRQAMPGLQIHAQEGELVVSPLHFARQQPKFYDAIDQARAERPQWQSALAEEARALMRNRPPDRALPPTGYGVENGYFDAMEAGIRWFSVSNVEKRSTALGRVHPPFTLAALFAAGVADYIGFAVGRNARIMCPMETHRHEVVLHVAADGRYVLLRDGELVRPVSFETAHYAPLRLADEVEPRLAVWNIDNNLVTQHVRFWERPADSKMDVPVKYSILIVCTRFSRRLQAALSSLAHQQNFDLRTLEVIVGYVPGIDATDDVLQSFQAAHPELRIVRAPFNEEHKNKKGFLINESAKLARGEWIVLMDADILLPPDMFARVDEYSGDSVFIAPDGRKMLDPETTGRILLGEVHPWECWQDLLKTAGEYRLREARGVPIGYFQCVKAECMRKIPHLELDHFETADMEFGMAMLHKYGKVTRLSGTTVIHMDHGGSQWYGTATHR
jgi:hypothetical protein